MISNRIQAQYTLKITTIDSTNTIIKTPLIYKSIFSSEEEIKGEITRFSDKLDIIGYVEHTIPKIIKKNTLTIVTFSLGKKTTSIRILFDASLDPKMLKKIPFKTNYTYFESTIEDVPKLLQSVADTFADEGFSFSEVKLIDFKKINNQMIATLIVKHLNRRKINKIIVKGYEGFPKKFLKHHFSINNKTIFNSKKIEDISNSSKLLPFVSEIKKPEVLFTKDSTIVYMYLKKHPTNSLDALVGFSSKKNGKITFNGYFDINLNNAFNKGTSLKLKWQRTPEEQNTFNLHLKTPYIFNTTITPTILFNILKQDSTYVRTKASFDIAIRLNTKSNVAAVYETEDSNKLLTGITTIKSFKNSFYGLSYTYQLPTKTSLFPTKFSFFGKILTGNRKVLTQYTKQVKYQLSTYFLWNLNKKNNIFIKNQSGILSSNNYLENEVFRIGGTNSIRGFNEASVYTTTFSLINVEYRYLTNHNAYIYSITDYGYIKPVLENTFKSIYGLGLGYVVRNNSRILNISYALGKEKNSPFDIKASKFHIKYIFLF